MLKGRGKNPSVRTLEYIEEVKIERRLGRRLNSNESSRPTSWGSVIESRVATILAGDNPFEYKYASSDTLTHPTISDWCGTPDLVGADKVADIKCPYTLKSFVKLSDICLAQDSDKLKQQFPEYYWQLVSNAIITGKDKAELIVYCPYQSELDSIRENIANLDDTDLQTDSQWIAFSPDEKLPYLPDGGYYHNLNRFEFVVTVEDKNLLTQAVENASQQLDDCSQKEVL